MSRGSKSAVIQKAQYYVQYLGWKECKGLGGREFTEPIVKDLVIRRKNEDLPKLTIEVSKKELKIYQLIEHKRGKTEKIKYPTVPAKDLTYVTQGLSPDEDIVACIYLGFNPTTRSAVHVHVYRFDSSSSAELYVKHLNQIISIPEHQDRLAKVEEELVAKGQITPRPRGFMSQYSDGQSTVSGTDLSLSTFDQDLTDEEIRMMNMRLEQKVKVSQQPRGNYSTDMPKPSGSSNGQLGTIDITQWGKDRKAEELWIRSRQEAEEYDEDDIYRLEKEMKQDSLASELKSRLALQKSPILLPPKDYDTVTRTQGNLLGIEQRRCQNEVITGGDKRNSGGDSARGDSDTGSFRYSDDGVHDMCGSRTKDMPGSLERQPASRSEEAKYRESDDLIPVSPRWKTGAQYMPPSAGRPTSPGPSGMSPWEQSANSLGRPRSPARGRARSPGRDRVASPDRSPYSPHQMNPIYDFSGHRAMSPVHQGDPYGDPYSRDHDPRNMRDSRDPRDPRDIRDPREMRDQRDMRDFMDPRDYQKDPRSRKKYTAANLGLANPNRGMRPGPDEGYTSIDSQDPRYGNPYGMHPGGGDPYMMTAEKGKKDRKDKKGKKDKKGGKQRNPGDDIPIDYTLGPAVGQAFNYHRN